MGRCNAIAGLARVDAAIICAGLFFLWIDMLLLGLILLLFGVKWIAEDIEVIRKTSPHRP